MKIRSTALITVFAVALVACASAGATMVPIYRDALDSLAARSQVLKLSGHSCERRGGPESLTITVGRRTETCAYRTPVMGRNLEVAAVAKLLAETPRNLAGRAFLGLVLRAGGGTRYELRVFPAQRKVQLLDVTSTGTHYLAIEKDVAEAKGIGEANVLRLQAEGDNGRVKLIARLGQTVVAEALAEGTEVAGEYSAVSVGAPHGSHGVSAAFDVIVVRAPVRF